MIPGGHPGAEEYDGLVGAENVVDVDMYYCRSSACRRTITSCWHAPEVDAKPHGLRRRAAPGRKLPAGLAAPSLVTDPSRGVVEIRLRSDPLGTKVWFIDRHSIEPGQTVRWVNEVNVHLTAYHPDNDGHAPQFEAAEPWT
jgi:hypothetical protein